MDITIISSSSSSIIIIIIIILILIHPHPSLSIIIHHHPSSIIIIIIIIITIIISITNTTTVDTWGVRLKVKISDVVSLCNLFGKINISTKNQHEILATMIEKNGTWLSMFHVKIHHNHKVERLGEVASRSCCVHAWQHEGPGIKRGHAD